MPNFIFTIIANMAGLWVADRVLDGLHVMQGTSTAQTLLIYSLLALILTVLNLVVRPLLSFLTFPLYILTFGLFSLVINAAMIGLTGWISDALYVNGFWTALFAGVIISLIASVVTALLARLNPNQNSRSRRR